MKLPIPVYFVGRLYDDFVFKENTFLSLVIPGMSNARSMCIRGSFSNRSMYVH